MDMRKMDNNFSLLSAGFSVAATKTDLAVRVLLPMVNENIVGQ